MTDDRDKQIEGSYLTGRLLLAMPAMADSRFEKAVIYVCAHDENGAMGLVINYPMPGIDLAQLLTQLDIKLDDEDSSHKSEQILVMSGGPVENARGFVLHSNEFEQSDTIRIDENFSVTGTVDALKAIASGNGPEKMLFMLGYAGWGAGQLDQEIQDNAWLVIDADGALIFEHEPEDKWDRAIAKLGINPHMLSGSTGRA